MKKDKEKKKASVLEVEDLRIRLEEAEETLSAIRRGEVDALVVSGPEGDKVYTLSGANRPYRFFVEAMNEGAVTLSPDGTILYCNNRFAEMVGTPYQRVIGDSFSRFTSSSDAFDLAFQKGKQDSIKTEALLRRKGNYFVPVSLSFNPMKEDEASAVCLVVTDLAETKRLEEELREVNAHLEELVQDRTEELSTANVALRAEIVQRKRVEEELQKYRDELELRVQARTHELESVNADLKSENEERLQVEIELRESENRLREISSELLKAQENERRVIAREIHDSLGSSLTAAKFKVESTLTEVGEKHPRTKAALESTLRMLQETIQETRRIQTNLRPPMLDDLGILPTINWFCRQYEATYSPVRVVKEINLREEDVADSLKTTIFRIVQEALNNSAKHSKASEVLLQMSATEGAIKLVIRDNGHGFDPAATLSRECGTRGQGLLGMQERVELSGGAFAVESSTRTGTVIRASWPSGPAYC